MDGGRRGRSRRLAPLLALQTAVKYSRLYRKPPVTAALIVANTVVHLRPGPLDRLLPPIHDVYINPRLILENRDLKRFFLSVFYHREEAHLFYNMLSLLWKGTQLEISLGSIEFTSMVAALLGMSQGITLLMAKILLFFDEDVPYYREYSTGFSGVLFATKAILNSQSDGYRYVHGWIVPSCYAAWVELFIIKMLVPDVPFLGHLGGILAGLLYLKIIHSFRGPDPFASLVRSLVDSFASVVRFYVHGCASMFSDIIEIVKLPLEFMHGLFFGRSHGSVGGSSRSIPDIWRCRTCTYVNDTLEDVREMCHTERNAGNHGCNSHSDLTLDELRQRRIERFDR